MLFKELLAGWPLKGRGGGVQAGLALTRGGVSQPPAAKHQCFKTNTTVPDETGGMGDGDRSAKDQPGVCSAAVTWDGAGAGHGHVDVIFLEEEPLHAAAVVRAGLTAKDHGSLEDFHRVEGGGLAARLGIDATFAAAPGEGQLAWEPVLIFINAVG